MNKVMTGMILFSVFLISLVSFVIKSVTNIIVIISSIFLFTSNVLETMFDWSNRKKIEYVITNDIKTTILNVFFLRPNFAI